MAGEKVTGYWKWPWEPFVAFSILCAWLPGFLFAVLLGLVPVLKLSAVPWRTAMVASHGHAMLVGWGGSMIIGVALHFLPKLRGAKLVTPEWVPWLFVAFVVGTTGHIVIPLLLALLDAQDFPRWTTVLEWSNDFVLLIQVLAILGLLAILIITFKKGPPLAQKRGFRQILFPLLTVGMAFLSAQVFWLSAAVEHIIMGRSSVLLATSPHMSTIEMLLWGGVPAISLGMSSRFFPLVFRTQPPSNKLIDASSIALSVGVLMTLLIGFKAVLDWQGSFLQALAAFSFGVGILLTVPAVKVMHPQTPMRSSKDRYCFWRDPAGIGVLTAYLWAAVGAVLLLIYAAVTWWTGMNASVFILKDLARHTMGAGFMTLLIISVGWTMLPGFAGGSPRGPRWMWCAVILANLAVMLRVLPGAFSLLAPSLLKAGFYSTALVVAGVLGWLAIGAFTVALLYSRKPGERGKRG